MKQLISPLTLPTSTLKLAARFLEDRTCHTYRINVEAKDFKRAFEREFLRKSEGNIHIRLNRVKSGVINIQGWTVLANDAWTSTDEAEYARLALLECIAEVAETKISPIYWVDHCGRIYKGTFTKKGKYKEILCKQMATYLECDGLVVSEENMKHLLQMYQYLRATNKQASIGQCVRTNLVILTINGIIAIFTRSNEFVPYYTLGTILQADKKAWRDLDILLDDLLPPYLTPDEDYLKGGIVRDEDDREIKYVVPLLTSLRNKLDLGYQ